MTMQTNHRPVPSVGVAPSSRGGVEATPPGRGSSPGTWRTGNSNPDFGLFRGVAKGVK